MSQNCRQRQDERLTALTQLVQTFVDHEFQGTLAARKQNHAKLPMVVNAWRTAHKTPRCKSIDQTNGAVMPEKQAFRQSADAGTVWIGEPAEGQQHLVLLWLEPGGFRGQITAANELSDAVAQLRQRCVFRVANCSSHARSIS